MSEGNRTFIKGSISLTLLLVVIGTFVPVMLMIQIVSQNLDKNNGGVELLPLAIGFWALVALVWTPLLVTSFGLAIAAIIRNSGRSPAIITLSIMSLFLLGAVIVNISGEHIEHSSCHLTDKSTSQKSQSGKQYNYYIDSTCGKFSVDGDAFDELNLDTTYDLVTTKGNWVSKPTIISFTETR